MAGCTLSQPLPFPVRWQGGSTHGMSRKLWPSPFPLSPGLLANCLLRTFGPKPHLEPHNFSSGLVKNKNKKKPNKLKLSNSLVLRLLSQHVHSFWHKNQGHFWSSGFCWLVLKSFLRHSP